MILWTVFWRLQTVIQPLILQSLQEPMDGYGLRPHTITANIVVGLDEYLLIINIEQKCCFQVSHLMVDGSQVTDPQKIASAFNQYFVNVPKQVNKEIPRTIKSPMDYLTNGIGNSFFSKTNW